MKIRCQVSGVRFQVSALGCWYLSGRGFKEFGSGNAECGKGTKAQSTGFRIKDR